MKDSPFRWAKKVPCEWIARLYAADASVPDEELADRVGWALAARCDNIVAVTVAYETGQLPCPRCGETILRKEDGFVCPCGFAGTAEEFAKSYRGKQLYGANAMPVFRRFLREFPRAQEYREKMSAIDDLIHGFHLLHSWRLAENEENQAEWTEETGAEVPLGRSAAVNLLEGSLTEVLRFLERLSADTGAPEAFLNALRRSNGFPSDMEK